MADRDANHVTLMQHQWYQNVFKINKWCLPTINALSLNLTSKSRGLHCGVQDIIFCIDLKLVRESNCFLLVAYDGKFCGWGFKFASGRIWWGSHMVSDGGTPREGQGFKVFENLLRKYWKVFIFHYDILGYFHKFIGNFLKRKKNLKIIEHPIKPRATIKQ